MPTSPAQAEMVAVPCPQALPGRTCRATLMEIPPHWSARARPLYNGVSPIGWGLIVVCTSCERKSEVLVSAARRLD